MFDFRRSRIIWIWLLLVFLALFLVSSNLGEIRPWSLPEQVLVELTAPLQSFLKKTSDSVKGVWGKYFALVGVYEKNQELSRELDRLRMQNAEYREMSATHERLQELLKFKQETNWPMTAARVIGWDPSGWFKSVVIDKGSGQGLSVNMPVVNAMGIVGRVVSVSPDYAKVLLIIDQNSSVDCLSQETRDQGTLKGVSAKVCMLDYVVKTSRIAPGDTIITSGMGGVFPKGLRVGQVISVSDRPGAMFKEVRVRPAVDFSKLEEVLVILKEAPLASNSEKAN